MKKRHRWSTKRWTRGLVTVFCHDCDAVRQGTHGSKRYRWKDGKWRTKCPPCRPKGDKSREDRNIMLTAAKEIDDLRRVKALLSDYRRHTERLLSLFERGPQFSNDMSIGEDITWLLRERAEELKTHDPEPEKVEEK